MSAESRAVLKAFFETGDKPTQDEFADLIDSFFNLTDDTVINLLQTLYNSATETKVMLDNDSGASVVFSTAGGGLVHIALDSGVVSFAGSFVNLEAALANIGFDYTFVNFSQFDIFFDVTNVPATSSFRMFQMTNNSGTKEIGFFGSATVPKPNITGSRGGNAALASLLTGLANLGLITDGTSA